MPRITLPVRPGMTVEGLVDVNGHDLAAHNPSDRGAVADDKYRRAFVRRWSPGV